jgi:hypothetical protein
MGIETNSIEIETSTILGGLTMTVFQVADDALSRLKRSTFLYPTRISNVAGMDDALSRLKRD